MCKARSVIQPDKVYKTISQLFTILRKKTKENVVLFLKYQT